MFVSLDRLGAVFDGPHDIDTCEFQAKAQSSGTSKEVNGLQASFLLAMNLLSPTVFE